MERGRFYNYLGMKSPIGSCGSPCRYFFPLSSSFPASCLCATSTEARRASLCLLPMACMAMLLLSARHPLEHLSKRQEDAGLSQQRLCLFFSDAQPDASRESDLCQAAALSSE